MPSYSTERREAVVAKLYNPDEERYPSIGATYDPVREMVKQTNAPTRTSGSPCHRKIPLAIASRSASTWNDRATVSVGDWKDLTRGQFRSFKKGPTLNATPMCTNPSSDFCARIQGETDGFSGSALEEQSNG
jgi:hypothetical protein